MPSLRDATRTAGYAYATPKAALVAAIAAILVKMLFNVFFGHCIKGRAISFSM
ncbi:MAG: hypothetical protein V7K97_10470 [Nostoc sp.]|uniref:hypothetical protein n=1 Tax=Nostoc sp. TaxID=1180 RepID=UPI002FFD48B9